MTDISDGDLLAMYKEANNQTADEMLPVSAQQIFNAMRKAYSQGLTATRPITWPAGREAGRMGEMTPLGDSHLRVGLDGDNDVYVAVYNAEDDAVAGLEFCTPGLGGGRSSRTREALIALMVAIEADNRDSPERAFPPLQRKA